MTVARSSSESVPRCSHAAKWPPSWGHKDAGPLSMKLYAKASEAASAALWGGYVAEYEEGLEWAPPQTVSSNDGPGWSRTIVLTIMSRLL